MGLRVNQNISAVNTHRNLVANDRALTKSLEKLASGLKVNRAGDGPAVLIISEQMRAQIKGLNQAIDNSEAAIGMVQTTESALVEVTNMLTSMRQLAIAANNEGVMDESMLNANQLELTNALDTIDRLTANASFGRKRLLDGSTGANGVGIGQGMEFVAASPETKASPIEGYDVRVTRLGAQARIKGGVALTEEMVKGREEFSISEGGKVVSFIANPDDSVAATLGKLRSEVKEIGLKLDMVEHEDGTIEFIHQEYGMEPTFSVSSSTPGILSKESRVMEEAERGADIAGFIGGDLALGKGQVLTGIDGTKIEGLKVRYTGSKTSEKGDDDPDTMAGRVAVYQNSLVFQVGPDVGQTTAVSMVNTNTRVLGRGIPNESGYRSIRDIDITTAKGATDAQKLIDQSIDEVNVVRAALGATQKNTLEANLRQLRINTEELTSAESTIRDSDMAKEVTEFTRNSIMTQSATAMLAQANQVPQTILSLLG